MDWSARSAPGRRRPPPRRSTPPIALSRPGLINTHHHLFQNLTRAWSPMTDKPLFGWLQSLYPRWRALDTEAAYLSAWIGLAELAMSGCTTSTDHLYLHPQGAGDLLAAEIDAARDLGVRFHPTRGSMSLSAKDGGLPPDDVVADDDEILAGLRGGRAPPSRSQPRRHGAGGPRPVLAVLGHRGPDGSIGRAGRAPRRAVAHPLRRERRGRRLLAGHLRLPPHRLPGADRLADRSGLAGPLRDAAARRGDAARSGRRRRGPLPVEQPDPRVRHRARRCAAGGRCARRARRRRVLVGRLRFALARGPPGDVAGQAARRRRRRARLGWRWRWPRSAAPPVSVAAGELGVLTPGAVGDVAVWPLTGPVYAGVVGDPIEGWLRSGPVFARHTVVHGRPVVRDGALVHPAVEDRLRAHAAVAARFQTRAGTEARAPAQAPQRDWPKR